MDPFETTATRGRPRARRNPPEYLIYHDFGDWNIYDHVNEQDDDERYVSEQVIEDQDAGEQDFSDKDVGRLA